MILKTLTLVHDQVGVLPDLVQPLLVPDRHLVARHDYREIVILTELGIERTVDHGIPILRRSVKPHHGVAGKPFFEFTHPVGQSGERRNDHERTSDFHRAEMRD